MIFKVAYITNLAPHYRNRLWLRLVSDKEIEYHFFYGHPKINGIKEIDFTKSDWTPFQNRLHILQNYRIRNVLFYQMGLDLGNISKEFDAFIFLGDLHILSNWISAIRLKLTKKPVIFWGHGLYTIENTFKNRLRKLFLKLPDINLVYGEYARNLMSQSFINIDKIRVVYNSLDYVEHRALRDKVLQSSFYGNNKYFKNSELPVLIFIGRLTIIKNLEKLIDSVKELINSQFPLNLILVGNGEDEINLKEQAKDYSDYIYFYGSCYDEEMIGYLIANADLCVSPGNVGLTAIHSLSFGTPVCTHDDYTLQMPEVEAIKEGITGTFFNLKRNDLTATIKKWLLASHDRELLRMNCYDMVDSKFNPENQTQIINSAVKSLVVN